MSLVQWQQGWRACAEKLAADFDRIASSTRESLVSTPPEYVEERITHAARAAAFARSAEIARGLMEHAPGPVADGDPLPPAEAARCAHCGQEVVDPVNIGTTPFCRGDRDCFRLVCEDGHPATALRGEPCDRCAPNAPNPGRAAPNPGRHREDPPADVTVARTRRPDYAQAVRDAHKARETPDA